MLTAGEGRVHWKKKSEQAVKGTAARAAKSAGPMRVCSQTSRKNIGDFHASRINIEVISRSRKKSRRSRFTLIKKKFMD